MQLVDFILCDDIRSEQFNKVSLMGLYNEALNIEYQDLNAIKFPIGVKLGVYIRFRIDKDDKLKKDESLLFSLAVRANNLSDELVKVEGRFNYDNELSPFIAIPLVLPPIPVKGEGKLTFDFNINNCSFKHDFEIRLRHKN